VVELSFPYRKPSAYRQTAGVLMPGLLELKLLLAQSRERIRQEQGESSKTLAGESFNLHIGGKTLPIS